MPDDNTNNNNRNNRPNSDVKPVKQGPVKPVHVEPTKSFAIDLRQEFTGPPLMNTAYTVLFRPPSDWAGKEYGFDWLHIGDSEQWCDKQPDDHYAKRIGKYYKSDTINSSNTGNVTGKRQLILNIKNVNKVIKKSDRFDINGAYGATNTDISDKEIYVYLTGSGNTFYSEIDLQPNNNYPPLISTPPERFPFRKKSIIVSVAADATVEGDIHGTFSGVDDGVGHPSVCHVKGSISGSSINNAVEGEYSNVTELEGTLTSDTSDVGYYGNDENDYRYMKAIGAAKRLKTNNPSYVAHNTTFVARPALYKKMLKENFPISFAILWKLREQYRNPQQVPTDPVGYEVYRSNIIYSVPILFILNGKTAKLKIKPEIDQSIPLRPIRIEFREKTPAENNFTIPPFIGNMNNGGEIRITCNKTFTDFKYIDAFAVYDESINPIFCGQIRVHPNSVIRRLNIVFVSVRQSGTSTPNAPVNNSNEVKLLKNLYEDQAMLNIQIAPPKELIIPTSMNKTHDNLCRELNVAYPNTYGNHIKVFLVAGGGTSNTDYNRRSIILYSGRLYETFSHEMGHALGLPHTFTNKEIAERALQRYINGSYIDPSSNADVTYQGRMTENIMDYSHSDNDDFEDPTGNGGTTGKRYSLFYWQIRKIWQDVDRLNGSAMSAVPPESSNEKAVKLPFDLYEYHSKARI